MSNLKKYMLKGYALCAVSIVIGTSLIPSSGVYGKLVAADIEHSKSETPLNSSYDKDAIINQSTSEELDPYGQVVNIETSLCVRKEPNQNSTTLRVLREGMTFEILSKTGKWYEIRYNDIQGFVHEDYVEEYENTPPNKVYEENYGYKKAIRAELTAYCNDPRCSAGWGSQTSMGTRTKLGVIAAPKDIPLGSKVYIPELTNIKSDGIFDVEDRGGAIKVKADGTYVIDVWLPSYEEAVAFGRKTTTIYLVE